MEETKKTGPRDVFLQLLSIIFLYASVIALGNLLFNIINAYFPNPQIYEGARFARSAIRMPLSILVIFFPLYVWTASFIQKDLLRYPERRELKTRKWLLYLTLFLTTLVIAGDLVALIFQFLNGDFTTRFLLKVLVVLLIAAGVFAYYIWNLRKDIPATRHPRMRLFVYGAIGFVAAAAIAGFFVAGSPAAERMRRSDEQRVGDLQNIQYQVVYFWQAKQRLPASLNELNDPIRGFVAPQDPRVGTPYEYRSTGDLSFELCATFETVSEADERSMYTKEMPPAAMPVYRPDGGPAPADSPAPDSWAHSAGRTCFERTIDPEFNPPLSKPAS